MKVVRTLSIVSLLSSGISLCGGESAPSLSALFHPDSSKEVIAAIEKSGMHEQLIVAVAQLRGRKKEHVRALHLTPEREDYFLNKAALYDFCTNFCSQEYWATIKPLLKKVFPVLAKTDPAYARFEVDYECDGSLIKRDLSDKRELTPLTESLNYVSLPQKYIDASTL